MKGALVILVVLVLVGVMLYVAELIYKRRKSEELERVEDGELRETEGTAADGEVIADSAESAVCCGQHLVCEKDSLSPVDAEIEYYDDEELDRFRGRSAEEYSEDEIEEIRDVLMTLREDDIAGWARSITKRGVELPTPVRDELLLLVRAHRGIEG